MTELERVEIEGFKGLEYVEFEPTDINLITGRNNTGKTSFLEAVDLLFNPVNLTDFGDNLDSVIHVDFEHSEIRGKNGETEVEIALRKPSSAEAEKHFLEATPVISGHRVSPTFGENNTESGEEFESTEALLEKVGDVTDRAFRDILAQDGVANLREELLMVSTATDEYPCFLEKEASTAIMEEILNEVNRDLGEEVEIEAIDLLQRNGPVGRLKIDSRVISIGFPPENSFLKRPENTDSATYIKSVDLTERIEQTDDEQDPIRIDDISDLLKEKEVVGNLKTLTLDYLVFEDENGEKDQIPYEFMGDGFKSMVGLLWELMDDEIEDQIVLIEEPENHMHPGYVREMVYFLIDLAREENVQLFITTHDSDFINDFFTENLTDDEEAYLKDEFSLLRMEEDSAVVEDYETARENLKEHHLDLRGI